MLSRLPAPPLLKATTFNANLSLSMESDQNMPSCLKPIFSYVFIAALLAACQPAVSRSPSLPDLSNKRIAFNSTRDGHSEVYTMEADGSDQVRLTVFEKGDSVFGAWSPDGTHIAFISQMDETAQVYVASVDGSHQFNLSEGYRTGDFDLDMDTHQIILTPIPTRANDFSPVAPAGTIRKTLFDIQLILGSDPILAARELEQAQNDYSGEFSDTIKTAAPVADTRILAGFDVARHALEQKDVPAFAAARAQIWTAILAGSYATVENSLRQGDISTAQLWLPVREFRSDYTLLAPEMNAAMAIFRFSQDEISSEDMFAALRADLYDSYQARLDETLRDLAQADANGFAARRTELAALAEGYFLIIAPAYGEQLGPQALERATRAFSVLRTRATSGAEFATALQQAGSSLQGFRAVQLSPTERARRLGQLVLYTASIPAEYENGVSDGQVVRDFEIQEAIGLHAGAYSAFSDLEYLLGPRDPAEVAQARTLLDSLGKDLDAAGKQTAVADPEEIRSQATKLSALFAKLIPADWLENSSAVNMFELYEADPAWSPDGKKIALISNDGVGLENKRGVPGGHLNIYVMNANASNGVEVVSNHPKYNGQPAWSPDGKKIAFVSDRDNDLEIYLMNPDGSQQTNLTRNPGFDQSITWSPDGRKIAFVSDRDRNSEIYVMNADGSEAINLTHNLLNDQAPDWSPDGRKIAFASINKDGYSEIFVMNADGTGQINLTNTPTTDEITPKWSPDGSQIAFASNQDGNLDIFVMNADGSGKTNLTHDPADDSDPTWQP